MPTLRRGGVDSQTSSTDVQYSTALSHRHPCRRGRFDLHIDNTRRLQRRQRMPDLMLHPAIISVFRLKIFANQFTYAEFQVAVSFNLWKRNPTINRKMFARRLRNAIRQQNSDPGTYEEVKNVLQRLGSLTGKTPTHIGRQHVHNESFALHVCRMLGFPSFRNAIVKSR